MEAFSNRIQTVMEHYKLTASRLAEKCGVQRSAISHILNGRNRPSVSFLMTLSDAYPELNTRWLLHGKGDMITSVTTAQKNVAESAAFAAKDEQTDREPPANVSAIESSEKSDDEFTKVNTNVNTQSIGAFKQASTRKVVKVILFYEDGTFSQHPPQD